MLPRTRALLSFKSRADPWRSLGAVNIGSPPLSSSSGFAKNPSQQRQRTGRCRHLLTVKVGKRRQVAECLRPCRLSNFRMS